MSRVCLLLCALSLLACPGSNPSIYDGSTGSQDVSGRPDAMDPDFPRYPDGVVWPDHSIQPDLYAQPDSYVSTPFGCVQDSDCFGKKCCPTPWGLKLCTDDCE